MSASPGPETPSGAEPLPTPRAPPGRPLTLGQMPPDAPSVGPLGNVWNDHEHVRSARRTSGPTDLRTLHLPDVLGELGDWLNSDRRSAICWTLQDGRSAGLPVMSGSVVGQDL